MSGTANVETTCVGSCPCSTLLDALTKRARGRRNDVRHEARGVAEKGAKRAAEGRHQSDCMTVHRDSDSLTHSRTRQPARPDGRLAEPAVACRDCFDGGALPTAAKPYRFNSPCVRYGGASILV